MHPIPAVIASATTRLTLALLVTFGFMATLATFWCTTSSALGQMNSIRSWHAITLRSWLPSPP